MTWDPETSRELANKLQAVREAAEVPLEDLLTAQSDVAKVGQSRLPSLIAQLKPTTREVLSI